MTVTYTAQVSSCKTFGCFWKLLFRWKGSIYKLLWPNLIVYVSLYFTLSFVYRFILDETQRRKFEKVSLHCQTYCDLIPVSFVLGFYVSIVVTRWWNQYLSIPWPDAFAMYLSSFISGKDEQSRLVRRTIIRHANLSLVFTFRMIAPSVKKRFPTLDHLVEAGLMLKNEKKYFEKLDEKTNHPRFWLPLIWSTSILTKARQEGLIPEDRGFKTLIDELIKFRSSCGNLLNYDWISVPLVYTQVVTLAVYTYFLSTLMGNQCLDPSQGFPNHTIDYVVPVFTLLQFFFYMGWLLVAETLVNPFGEDDDDFEVNWLIDRNLHISYLIVDELHDGYPDLAKDQYWEEVVPNELPYTEAARHSCRSSEPFYGSTRYVNVPFEHTRFVFMSTLPESESLNTVDYLKKRKATTPVEITSRNYFRGEFSMRDEKTRGSKNSLITLFKRFKRNVHDSSKFSSVYSSNRRMKSDIHERTQDETLSQAGSFKRNSLGSTDIFTMSSFTALESTTKVQHGPDTLAAFASETPKSLEQKSDARIKSWLTDSNIYKSENVSETAVTVPGLQLLEGLVGSSLQNSPNVVLFFPEKEEPNSVAVMNEVDVNFPFANSYERTVRTYDELLGKATGSTHRNRDLLKNQPFLTSSPDQAEMFPGEFEGDKEVQPPNIKATTGTL